MAKLIIERKYGQVPNEVLNNPELSLKAKGLFAYLQSKPDGWEFSIRRISRQTKDGKEGIRSALKELEKHCYLRRYASKDDAGKWDGYRYILSEKPLPEKPSTEKPSTEKPYTLSNKDIVKKNTVKKKEINILSNKLDETAVIKRIFKKWNTFAKEYGLPKIQHITGTRKQKLRARLKEKSFDFDQILEKIKESDFLLGIKTDWRVDFDFIIRSENTYVKILEGKYSNNSRAGKTDEEIKLEQKKKEVFEMWGLDNE